ncbi:MAG: hypothetical protein B6I17_02370 [Tenericutes bacterium 4572_104]|nr:MAG: hypothetical protein B6I17_02370 [Tenericutes bacterium 4572_104]
MKLEDKIRMNSLYDIYGKLLTEKQRMYYEYYYLSDYSLSEISEILSVSRNAVHMQLKNVVNHLENYEKTLKMLEKKKKINSLINQIEKKKISLENIKKQLEKV